MNFKQFLEQQQDLALLKPYFDAVARYLGVQPNIAKFLKYSEDEWGRQFGTDNEELFGRTAAVFTPDRQLHVRQSRPNQIDDDGSLLHEIVHAAGYDKKAIAEEFNEGMTQLVAEEIGRLFKIQVVPTYQKDVEQIRKYVLPLVGMNLQAFAQAYAKASNQAELVATLIYKRYWNLFQNEEEWGPNDRNYQIKSLMEQFYSPSTPSLWSPHPRLTYIVDEVMAKK